MGIVDIYETTTTHYRIDLGRGAIVSEVTLADAPEFYADGDRIEGGVADQAFDLLRSLRGERREAGNSSRDRAPERRAQH